jgi:hypothetical protein
VLGRLFYQNCEAAVRMISSLSGTDATTQLAYPLPQLLSSLVDVWVSKLDCIAHVYKKKVCVLGLIQLVPSGDAVVLSKLRGIMGAVRRIEKELAAPGAYIDQPDWSVALQTPVDQRIESHRIQLMLKDDPSNNVSVRTTFLEKLTQLSTIVGAAPLEQMLNSCDQMVWSQIRDGAI